MSFCVASCVPSRAQCHTSAMYRVYCARTVMYLEIRIFRRRVNLLNLNGALHNLHFICKECHLFRDFYLFLIQIMRS